MSWKVVTDINLVSLMHDEIKTFRGSLIFGVENLMTSRAHTITHGGNILNMAEMLTINRQIAELCG